MSCVNDSRDKNSLFTLIDNSHAGIDFVNQLDETDELNTYTFRNFYNGAGVALGDINNDELLDLYFCGNTRDNRLYLNRGDFKFEDITQVAGVGCKGVWSTGVSMLDINNDGYLDLYVCKSGQKKPANRHNELFINNGDLTFTEKSKEYGLDVLGLSVHATFFDYDRDGDLDCYLLNNSFKSVDSFEPKDSLRQIIDPEGANMLLKNDDGVFKNVSEIAGIYSSNIGFGLGATVADLNNDHWPDLYISNDFFERDYLYINNQNGTFSEKLEEAIKETSMGAMGADIADINNDGYPEIYVTEMTPEYNERQKTKVLYQSWESYQKNLKNGYYHQFARNTLQLNNWNNTFSEIGRYADIAYTDWSWGALMFDMDQDGYKDIFVANGIYKDLLDRDYLEFYANPRNVKSVFEQSEEGIRSLIEKMPSVKVANYAFVNNHDLTFTNRSNQFGLADLSFSNGSAYGDLDNDGDLDLVVNNINMEPFVYRNESDKLRPHSYLAIRLLGDPKNKQAIGSKVILYCGKEIFYQELIPFRGFMSTVDSRLNFGLGEGRKVDSLMVVWPDGSATIKKDIPINRSFTIDKSKHVVLEENEAKKPTTTFFAVIENAKLPVAAHDENDFNDFERYKLLFRMRSNEGPKVCVGDINGDSMEDFYLSGAKGSPGKLFIQDNTGFTSSNRELFESEKHSEETDCIFFDADNDSDLDLYVACGSLEYPSSSTALIDKLYINDGLGNFMKSSQILPSFTFESTSCVRPSDIDDDGDLDLFVGVRMKSFKYGISPDSHILINDGTGIFKNMTKKLASDLANLGHVTDATWTDIDLDEDDDLVVVGEWMPISIFLNENGRLIQPRDSTGLELSNGWWNVIKPTDVDNDGDIDFVAGNHGLNSRFKASQKFPVAMYVNDFDLNGSVEQLITTYNQEISYPVVMRSELLEQMPSLKARIKRFEDYKHMTLDSLFDEDILSKSIIHRVYNLESSVILNSGHGRFKICPLPREAQFSPIYGILVKDWDGDHIQDILIGGNQTRVKPEAGIYRASYGLFLKGIMDGKFESVNPDISGINLEGEIRDLDVINASGEKTIMVARNNNVLQFLKPNYK